MSKITRKRGDKIDQDVRDALEKIRDQRGAQRRIADEVGVRSSTISRIRRGEIQHSPHAKKLRAVLARMDSTITDGAAEIDVRMHRILEQLRDLAHSSTLHAWLELAEQSALHAIQQDSDCARARLDGRPAESGADLLRRTLRGLLD